MLIRANETQAFTLPGGTSGQLYSDHPTGEQTLARVVIDGVYPERGWSHNQVCTEALLVLEGTLMLDIDGEGMELHTGDCYQILPGHYYRCSGSATVLDVITPAWDKGQNTIVETLPRA